jgi:DNA-binding NarL/FixJ family response regulator
MSVLIIEESLLIGGRIQSLLLESSSTMAIYHSVKHEKAIALFDEILPQVVVLDMCLPGMMPIVLLQEIKDKATETSIVVLVNCEDQQKQTKCKSIGVDFIIDKYHEFEKLPGILDSIVSKGSVKPSNEKPKKYSKFA